VRRRARSERFVQLIANHPRLPAPSRIRIDPNICAICPTCIRRPNQGRYQYLSARLCRRYAKLLTHRLSASRTVIRLVCVSPSSRFATINPTWQLGSLSRFACHRKSPIRRQRSFSRYGRIVYDLCRDTARAHRSTCIVALSRD